MRPRLLLVQPPIYDFTAYDFWLRPYGLLQAAGCLRGQADFLLFDALDRHAPDAAPTRSDRWGRGRFPAQRIPTPPPLRKVPRRYHRFGRSRERFRAFLAEAPALDAVLIQTGMTYWYPGVAEVIEDLQRLRPGVPSILGGPYATLCPEHAGALGADLVIRGADLAPLADRLSLHPDPEQPALWEVVTDATVGTIKLTDGCPCACTYCAVPQTSGPFRPRSRARVRAAWDLLRSRGVRHLAFYDDALLHRPEAALRPFLEDVTAAAGGVHLHSPNALHARLLSADLARHMVGAGFKTFYLGFDSAAEPWQRVTGNKVSATDLAQAVDHLRRAGAHPRNIVAYQILGHPRQDLQELEASLHVVQGLGIRGMLADYSPIPGTPDGDACARWVDMSEPLLHNKTAFPILTQGRQTVQGIKDLQQRLNETLGRAPGPDSA